MRIAAGSSALQQGQLSGPDCLLVVVQKISPVELYMKPLCSMAGTMGLTVGT